MQPTSSQLPSRNLTILYARIRPQFHDHADYCLMCCGRYNTIFYFVLFFKLPFCLSPTHIFPDLHSSLQVYFLFLWEFDPIPCQGLPVRSFATTLIGHTTLGRIPLDECPAIHKDLYLTEKTLTRGRLPCAQRDLNPQSQQTSGRRPKPQTVPSLGWAAYLLLSFYTLIHFPYLQFSITAFPLHIIILLRLYYNNSLCISAALPVA